MRKTFLIIICVITSLAVTDSRPGDKFRGDTVPFMLVVQHSNGPRCAGALVSMRSAVSTASCVCLSAGPITVMAGPYLTGIATIDEAVRRITSVVLPAGYVPSMNFSGAVNDVAVLRLEKPFGMSKLVKPILIEKDYAAYEKEGKLCNLVRALNAPVARQRREERVSLTDTTKSSQMTPIYRNLDFTISYEWFNLNFSDIFETTTNEDKPNTTFTENVITQSSIEVGQNIGNTSDFPKELSRSDWLEGEPNSTIAYGTLESAAMNNETIRIKRNIIKTSTTPALNITKHKERKNLVRNGTARPGNRSPATASPTSAMTIFRIYDVRTLNMEQCREDNILVGNRRWAAMSEQVVCTHGVNFCQTDWGTGLVCNGKLCALLSRVAHPTGQPIDAGCGTTHTLQSLGRWKKFLGCAHDRGNCDEIPCSIYCQENTLKLDEKYKLTTVHDDLDLHLASSPYVRTKSDSNLKSGQAKKLKNDLQTDSDYDYVDSDENKQKSIDSDDSDASDDESSDLSNDEQPRQRNDVTVKPSQKEELPKLKESLSTTKERMPVLREQLPAINEQLTVLTENLPLQGEHYTTVASTQIKTTQASLTPKRTTYQYSSTRPMTKELARGSSGDNERNLVEFEPFRADFKAGEYGENAIDYRDSSEDDYVITGNSTNTLLINSTTHSSSTTNTETSLGTDNITTTSLDTTLIHDTSVYDFMPKFKKIDGKKYKLTRSDATIIEYCPLLKLVIVFTGYLLR